MASSLQPINSIVDQCSPEGVHMNIDLERKEGRKKGRKIRKEMYASHTC